MPDTTAEPTHYTDPETIVDDVIDQVGTDIRLGVPLGLGKPNHIVNAFYRRAKADPDIDLTIFTALSLDPPRPSSDLERRLAEPIVERLFGDYPRLDYVGERKRDALPDNVDVVEFYLEPGAYLGHAQAQQDYIASNFTHVARDLVDRGLNVIAQLVSAPREDIPEVEVHPTSQRAFSLSSNSDITRDTLTKLREAGHFEDVPVIVQVNSNLPFMFGDAVLHEQEVDGVLEAPECDFQLFGAPNQGVGAEEYMIGMYASSLVRDGGTLQLGIGAISDAITYMLCRRDDDNAAWRGFLESAGALDRFGEAIERIGGLGTFERGLYGSTEMMVPGFIHLIESDILRRRVFDDLGLQTLLEEGRIDHRDCGPETLAVLVAAERVSTPLEPEDLAFLHQFGLLDAEVTLEDGRLCWGDGEDADGTHEVAADLGDPAVRQRLDDAGLIGESLDGGHLVHAGFFLGPASFYRALADMPDERRRDIYMGSISFINDLYGDQQLKMLQRKDARFVNSTMKVTLSGAAVSDGLADNQVVSGVGGQYNFVSMAHALPGGRSIIMLRATYDDDGTTRSNIVWEYPHATIPRHLKDIVVTEYGIADLRGHTDSRVAKELLKICDSRFQDDLLERAKEAGKIEADWEIPEPHRHNTPERIQAVLEAAREDGWCPKFPFDTDLTDMEVELGEALRAVQSKVASRDFSLPHFEQLMEVVTPPDRARPYLARMGLADPGSLRERGLQKVVLYGLSEIDAI